jgi:REP element-mobilizing transposase RayT
VRSKLRGSSERARRTSWASTSWPGGYFVSAVGLDENMVQGYIRNQGDEDERYDQMKLEMA